MLSDEYGQISAFFTIPVIDGNVVRTLVDAQLLLMDTMPKDVVVDWLEDYEFHITVRHIGNTSLYNAYAAAFECERKLKGVGWLHVSLSEDLGVFPDYRSPAVIWAGLSSDTIDDLMVVHKIVNNAVMEFGGSPPNYDYNPHITLGYIKHIPSAMHKGRLKKAIQDIVMPTYTFSTDALYLSLSEKLDNHVERGMFKIRLK